MRLFPLWPAILLGLALSAGSARAQSDEATHNELRALRDSVVAAFNKRDIDALVQNVHPNVVITWQNGEVVRGRDQLRAYFQRMMTGEHRVVEDFQINPDVKDLTILYGGDTGVAYGTSDDHIKLTNGMELSLHEFWSTTLVKDSGRWQVAAYQAGINAFDNPIMDRAVRVASLVVGAGALVVGLALGFFLARARQRQAA